MGDPVLRFLNEDDMLLSHGVNVLKEDKFSPCINSPFQPAAGSCQQESSCMLCFYQTSHPERLALLHELLRRKPMLEVQGLFKVQGFGLQGCRFGQKTVRMHVHLDPKSSLAVGSVPPSGDSIVHAAEVFGCRSFDYSYKDWITDAFPVECIVHPKRQTE